MKKILCTNFDGLRKWVKPSELKFRISAYAIIIKNRKILLSQQWDGYDFPGGGIEKGETIEQALKREIFEETGVKIKQGKILHVDQDFFIGTITKKPWHSILLYFECKSFKGKLSNKYLVGDEKRYSSGPQWISLKDIKKIKFKNGVDSLAIIKKAL